MLLLIEVGDSCGFYTGMFIQQLHFKLKSLILNMRFVADMYLAWHFGRLYIDMKPKDYKVDALFVIHLVWKK